MTSFGGSQWALFLAEAGSNTTQTSYRATHSQQPTPAKLHHQLPPTIHQPRHTAPRGRRTKKEENAYRATAKTSSQKHSFSKGKETKKGKNAQLKPAYTTNNPNAREAETTLKKKACSPARISRRWRRKKNLPQPPARIALTPGRAKDG